MIKKLKSRPRTDSFDREPPRARQRWDRLIYLTMLAGFVLALLNYVVGDLVFLRADGLVLRTRTVIAATSLVQVHNIDVAPGQHVRSGDELMLATSFEVLDRLTQVSILEAKLAEREAKLRAGISLSQSLLPLAESRAADLAARDRTLDEAQLSGLITASRRESVADDLHDANIELVTLTARVKGVTEELAAAVNARKQARQALDALAEHYASGIYRSGTDGVVGDTVPARGEVFNPGEPILTIMSGQPYILAYLPARHLFPIKRGDRVTITGGNISSVGTIERILPVSQSIPDEFRNAFRLDETRQLARIMLDNGNEFPIFSAVRIGRDTVWQNWRQAGQTFASSVIDARNKIVTWLDEPVNSTE